MTPKQKVLERYPKAYAARFKDLDWFVYQRPLTAAPRGQFACAVSLGFGATSRGAWADAARRMTKVAKSKTG